MIIQANSSLTNVAVASKKTQELPAPVDAIRSKHFEKNKTATPDQRVSFFEGIESLENNSTPRFRTSEIENKNEKFIQSYLDTQSLEHQGARDELHQQFGIDTLV